MALETDAATDTDDAEKRIAAGITARLNEAILKGEAAEVARRAGVPYASLREYLNGRQMRPAVLVLLARACDVRLEWLAAGEGPMRPGEQGRQAPSAPADLRLFGAVKIDRLVLAYEGALASTGGRDRRLTMHLTVVLYDQLSEAAEAAEKEDAR